MSGPRSTPTGGRLALIIIGGLVAFASVATLAFAGFLHWVNSQRDDGYFTTGTVRVGALNHALTSDLDVHRGLVSIIGKDGFSRVRLKAEATLVLRRIHGITLATARDMADQNQDKKAGPLDGSTSGTIGGGGAETGGPTERPNHRARLPSRRRNSYSGWRTGQAHRCDA